MRKNDIWRYERGGENLKKLVKKICNGEKITDLEFSNLKQLSANHEEVTSCIKFVQINEKNKRR